MKAGIELEFSDILSLYAVELLYGAWGRPVHTWRDRSGIYEKPPLDYTLWNAMTDTTLVNTDGSTCRASVMVDGRIAHIEPDTHQQLWKGIELISPAMDNHEEMLDAAERYSQLLFENGATARRSLMSGFHIHFDLSELPWQAVASLVRPIARVQYLLSRLSTSWDRRSYVTPSDLNRLLPIEAFDSAQQWWSEYRKVDIGERTVTKHERHTAHRRVVDVGPYFRSARPQSTIEFRCFSNSASFGFVRAQFSLAREVLAKMLQFEEVDVHWLEDSVNRINSMYVD